MDKIDPTVNANIILSPRAKDQPNVIGLIRKIAIVELKINAQKKVK